MTQSRKSDIEEEIKLISEHIDDKNWRAERTTNFLIRNMLYSSIKTLSEKLKELQNELEKESE